MKAAKTTLLLVFAVLLSAVVMAQPPRKATQKVVISLPTLTCDECKAVIENRLWKRVDGILAMEVIVKKKILRLTYAPDRVDLDNIRLMIADLGFDADTEKANPDGYKRLPKDCRDKTPVPTTPVPDDGR